MSILGNIISMRGPFAEKFVQIKVPDFKKMTSSITEETTFKDILDRIRNNEVDSSHSSCLIFPIIDGPELYRYLISDINVTYRSGVWSKEFRFIKYYEEGGLVVLHSDIRIEQTHMILQSLFMRLMEIKRLAHTPTSYTHLQSYELEYFKNISHDLHEEIVAILYLEFTIDKLRQIYE